MRHRWLVWIFAFVFTSVIQAQPPTDTAHVRFFHAVPDLPPVSLRLNDALLSDALAYGDVTEWITTQAGTFTVSVNETLLPALDVLADEWLTLIVTLDSQDRLALHTVREDVSQPDAQESRLTLHYGLVDSLPEVDMLLDGMLFAPGLPLGQDLTANVIANTYTVQLTTPDEPAEPLVEVNDITLEKESVYLLVIYGPNDAPQFELIVSNAPTTALEQSVPVQPTDTPAPQAQGMMALRFAHLSSGTPPIDIYLNGEKGNTRVLRFPDFTGWTSFPAGLYRVGVTLADAPSSETLIAPLDIEFEAGTFTNVMIIGALANNTLTLHLLEESYKELRQGAARLSILNAHPGAGPINVALENGVELVNQLGYPGYFGNNDGLANLIVDAGTYDLIFSADGDADMLFELPNRSLLSGRSYFITVISADPPFFLTFSDIGETEALLTQGE